MRKKWLALALSMAMVVGSITGCGGSDSNKVQVIHQRATIQQKWKQ